MTMHDVAQFMHDPILSPALLRTASKVTFVQGHTVQPHQHPLVELVYYVEGNVQCWIGPELVVCQPGMLRIMPPRVVHGEISHTAWSCFVIWLDVLACPPWPQLYVDDAYGTLGSLCGMLVREWNGQASDRDAMLGLLLHQLEVLLRRGCDQQHAAPAERLVREGERLLKEQFATSVTTGALAATLGVSASYLRTQFVRLRGHTPIACLHTLRVQHALALIRNSSMSLEAIAKLSGYDSSSHLSRHIKRATGARPGTFRGAPIIESETSHN